MDILYLCDGKACGPDNICFECKHTHDINHAINFEYLGDGKYFEKVIYKRDYLIDKVD